MNEQWGALYETQYQMVGQGYLGALMLLEWSDLFPGEETSVRIYELMTTSQETLYDTRTKYGENVGYAWRPGPILTFTTIRFRVGARYKSPVS